MKIKIGINKNRSKYFNLLFKLSNLYKKLINIKINIKHKIAPLD